MIGYCFVDDHRADYTIVDLCRVSGVCRSGYYAWRDRPPSAHARRDAELTVMICQIHKDSRRTYGRPRIWGQLARRGVRVSPKRVGRLMAEKGLVGVHNRKKWRRGRSELVPAGDLLNRDFTADRSDQRWVADITEFACVDGRLYLAGIVDLCDRGIVGWSMGEHQTTDLVIGALVLALARRRPETKLIHHADHGTQYTSLEFTSQLSDWGIVGSYGSVGDAYDNAAMEAVWATIKREIRHIWGPWSQFTRSELRTILFDYIETFYNNRRHQTGLDHRTPAEVYAAKTVA